MNKFAKVSLDLFKSSRTMIASMTQPSWYIHLSGIRARSHFGSQQIFYFSNGKDKLTVNKKVQIQQTLQSLKEAEEKVKMVTRILQEDKKVCPICKQKQHSLIQSLKIETESKLFCYVLEKEIAAFVSAKLQLGCYNNKEMKDVFNKYKLQGLCQSKQMTIQASPKGR